MFVRIAPKPIGSSSNGSNFLLIAKNKINRPTSSMIDWPEVRLKIPKLENITSKFINSEWQKVDYQV
jgi:hypothetical protein